MDSDLRRYLELAVRLADAVRPVVLRHFRAGVAIDTKEDASPVTRADRDAESTMRAMIATTVPDHGILGEEHGRDRVDAEWVWVLDPIDGTASFVTGKPLWGTLIALARGGRPVLGLIDIPALSERWIGCVGLPTTFNGAPTRTRDCASLAEAWLLATTPAMFRDGERDSFERLGRSARRVVFGGDCYNYGLLASGHADLVCEADLKPYDFCALAPVIAGAGGLLTDWEGRPVSLESDGRVLAAGSSTVHALALRLLGR